MQIDGSAERGGAFPKRIVGTVVEIFAVGVAVDHGAAELDSRMQRSSSSAAAFVLHGEMAETGITVGPLRHFLGEEIVGRARVAHRRRGVAFDLHAGPGDRQHDAGDAGFVHHRQPPFAEIGERAIKLRGLFGATSTMVGRQ